MPKPVDAFRRAALVAVLLAAAPGVATADLCAAYRIAVPADWTASAGAGIATYRSTTGSEAVTAAVYERVGDGGGQAEAMARFVEVGRRIERQWAGDRLVLSPVARGMAGALPTLRYSGLDPAGNRRFASLVVGAPRVLQHFYFETVGITAEQFSRRAQALLGSIALPQPDGPDCTLPTRQVRPALDLPLLRAPVTAARALVPGVRLR